MEPEKIGNRGISKLRVLVWLCLAVMLFGAAYFAWGPGRIEFYAQRLGAQDRDVALSSELALLELGEPGREVLYDYLLNKFNIKLPPMSSEGGPRLESRKIIAVSESGEVEVVGVVGPLRDVILLSDSAAAVTRVFRPLAALASTGAAKVFAAVLSPGSQLCALEIDLAYLDPKEPLSHMTLRVSDSEAELEGTPIAHPKDVEAVLAGKTAESVRILPRPDVRYGRLLRFAYYLRAAGKRPVLVFGGAEAFGMPSLQGLVELNRGLSAPNESQQVRAAVRLKTAMGELFTYDTSKPPVQNREAIDSWLEWFQKNWEFIYFDTAAGSYAFDAAASAAGIEHGKYWLDRLRIVSVQNGGSDEQKEE